MVKIDFSKLIRDRFYWVLVRSSTRGAEWQPARFTETCERWDLLGFNRDVAHHFVEVVLVGDEIVPCPPSNSGPSPLHVEEAAHE
jgi:hypothetical protein